MGYPEVMPHWDLYERHLDEAEFLQTQWENALIAPDKYLAHVAQREARLLAHVDALALGGDATRRRCLRPALLDEETSRTCAAALALLQQDGIAGRDAVLDALTNGPPSALPGLRRALELCGRGDVLTALRALLTHDVAPTVATLVLAVHAAQRRLPSIPLEDWLEHPAPSVVAAACHVLPFTDTALGPSLLRRWARALESPEHEVRDAALLSGAMLGLRTAWTYTRHVLESSKTPGRVPLLLMALGGNTREQSRLLELLQEPLARADVLWALGHGGRPEAADACLRLLADEDAGLARLATESFAAITGFPLEEDHLLPEDESLEDASPDAPVLLDVEQTLPRAIPTAASTWWKQQRHIVPGTRYLAGVPFSAATLIQSFTTTPARRWFALALELAIRSRGRVIVSARDFCFRRHRLLATAQGFAPRGEQPFWTLMDS